MDRRKKRECKRKHTGQSSRRCLLQPPGATGVLHPPAPTRKMLPKSIHPLRNLNIVCSGGWIPHGALKNVPLPPNFKVGPRKIFFSGVCARSPTQAKHPYNIEIWGCGGNTKTILKYRRSLGNRRDDFFLDCYNQSEKGFLNA